MHFRTVILLISTLLISCAAYASPIENIQGPVHEAYFTAVMGIPSYQAVAQTPPDALLERVPEQTDSQATWIPGYWQWDDDRNDYIWITGVWRKPPPNHQWVTGYWKKFEEGWVWLNGFWTDQPEEDLEYISAAPPAPQEEDLNSPPNNNYFWNPGFWSFDPDNKKYSWIGGAWAAFDEEWILVPAHYVWRDRGYVLVAPYWDYNFDKRGTIYTSLSIPPEQRSGYIYDPILAVDPLVVCRHYFSWYPDYLYFYNYHHHFHPETWVNWNISPPWWSWNSWWSLNWQNSWALWWWWGHPGYPSPDWMTASLAQEIVPPSKLAVGMLDDVVPPVIVTPVGVVAPQKLLAAVHADMPSKKHRPILPYNRKIIDQAVENISALPASNRVDVRPAGRLGPIAADLPKPRIMNARPAKQIAEVQIPNKPGMPAVIRNRPTTPGSEIKPKIRGSVFNTQVPNLAPSLNNTLQRDVFRPSTPAASSSDRSSVQYMNPEHADRPPYNKPTRIINTSDTTRTMDQPASPYRAPNYVRQIKENNFPGSMYEVPQASQSLRLDERLKNRVQPKQVIDPFNPEGVPLRKTSPGYFPPRPPRNREEVNIEQTQQNVVPQQPREVPKVNRSNNQPVRARATAKNSPEVLQRAPIQVNSSRNMTPQRKLQQEHQLMYLHPQRAMTKQPQKTFFGCNACPKPIIKVV